MNGISSISHNTRYVQSPSIPIKFASSIQTLDACTCINRIVHYIRSKFSSLTAWFKKFIKPRDPDPLLTSIKHEITELTRDGVQIRTSMDSTFASVDALEESHRRARQTQDAIHSSLQAAGETIASGRLTAQESASLSETLQQDRQRLTELRETSEREQQTLEQVEQRLIELIKKSQQNQAALAAARRVLERSRSIRRSES